MENVRWITDYLREAINILEAYQFPANLRASLALEEIEAAIAEITAWVKEE